MSELERLQEAGIDLMRRQRPAHLPLIFFFKPITDWIEARLIEIMRETAVPEARPAFNPVFSLLPADGCRLTELAAMAGMTKQSMGEIVEELIDLGYLARFPDPRDRRAKLIVRTEKGLQAHVAALAAFARIDEELKALLGADGLAALRENVAGAREAIARLDRAPEDG